ncbi:MAG: trans-AT polyketide synthase/acyltransferase/oxidoreductase domain-containing protein [Arenicella sp.]|jgi:trans-AT polyketide synthase/acyltransferase/oxidoreductase domain-containing protein
MHLIKDSMGDGNIACKLGDPDFKQDYGIKYAYLSGAMYRGIASKELVTAMGENGFMGFLGVGGVAIEKVASDIDYIQTHLGTEQAFGVNLLNDLETPETNQDFIEMYLSKGVSVIEAAAFMQITPALVYFRLKGLQQNQDGTISGSNRIIAKVSRPEVADAFMRPAPEDIVAALLKQGKVNDLQAQMARHVSMSEDICVEADSGGHTDQGIATVLLPSIQSLRQQIMTEYQYTKKIRIGLAGGIGTPTAAAAAFMMDADFILTGSINQCTIEAATSDTVKDLLQTMNVQDTTYAPAGDMFEMGAKVQVLATGVLFPARANKLFNLYRQYKSLDEIPENIRAQLQEKTFRQSLDQVWEQVKSYHLSHGRDQLIEKAERHLKQKMAMTFKWYFAHSTRLALAGESNQQADFQVHTGPALGAFNQWVIGTPMADWRNRNVHKVAELLMLETAKLISQKYQEFGFHTDCSELKALET